MSEKAFKIEQNDLYVLDTLAASHAEAGDFGAAAKWERKVGEMLDSPDVEFQRKAKDRLASYLARKSYQENRRLSSWYWTRAVKDRAIDKKDGRVISYLGSIW